jgi:hypothetical protein
MVGMTNDLNANGSGLTTSLCAFLRQQLAPEVKWKGGREYKSDLLHFPKIEVSDEVPADQVWMFDMQGNLLAKITNIGETK